MNDTAHHEFWTVYPEKAKSWAANIELLRRKHRHVRLLKRVCLVSAIIFPCIAGFYTFATWHSNRSWLIILGVLWDFFWCFYFGYRFGVYRTQEKLFLEATNHAIRIYAERTEQMMAWHMGCLGGTLAKLERLQETDTWTLTGPNSIRNMLRSYWYWGKWKAAKAVRIAMQKLGIIE